MDLFAHIIDASEFYIFLMEVKDTMQSKDTAKYVVGPNVSDPMLDSKGASYTCNREM